ncbi:MAG TPA: NAD(P)-binding domain-containing protein [Ktedonobacteraceae bacterium]|nr:NAD(P)-binding domain-containing protein [Ktedonobacteraceae bacterium]
MAGKRVTIAILGAGNIGGTLGKKWSAAGHQVRFGVQDPSGKHAQAVRAELGNWVVIDTIEHVLQGDPDVVLVALPGNAIEPTAQKYAAQFNGRIIIDAANRMGEDSMHNLAPFQQHAPQVQLYRAFNTLGWENFAEPIFNGIQADLFYCGPDREARTTVEQLISDVGLRPVYLGGVEQMGLLDFLTSLWFTLAFGQKKGRHLAFKVLVACHSPSETSTDGYKCLSLIRASAVVKRQSTLIAF